MYQQGYIPSQNQSPPQKSLNKRLIFIIAASVILIATATFLIINYIDNKKAAPSASSIVHSFVSYGFPVDNIVIYDSTTDPNQLLGRPDGYLSKASFADTKLDQIGSDPVGGTVEVFDSASAAKSRLDYVSVFDGTIFGSYCYLNGKVLLRLDYDLTPEQKKQYEDTLDEILK